MEDEEQDPCEEDEPQIALLQSHSSGWSAQLSGGMHEVEENIFHTPAPS